MSLSSVDPGDKVPEPDVADPSAHIPALSATVRFTSAGSDDDVFPSFVFELEDGFLLAVAATACVGTSILEVWDLVRRVNVLNE